MPHRFNPNIGPLVAWVPKRGRLPRSPRWIPGGQRPVLFLHGVVGSPGNFEAPAAILAKRGQAFFAPAYGRRGTAAIKDSKRELLAYLDQLADRGIEELDIVGHSAGGRMALLLAQERPEMVRRLVGLAAVFHHTTWPALRLPGARWVMGESALDLSQPFTPDIPDGVEVISFSGGLDVIVPAKAATLGASYHIPNARHDQFPWFANLIIQALDVPDVEQFTVPARL